MMNITNRQTLSAILEMLNSMNPDDVLADVHVSKDEVVALTPVIAISKIEKILESYNRKSATPKKPSSASIQNAEYARILFEYLEAHKGVGFSSAALAKVDGMPEECSGSKVSAISKHFPATVQTDKVNGKNIYFIPAEENGKNIYFISAEEE